MENNSAAYKTPSKRISRISTIIPNQKTVGNDGNLGNSSSCPKPKNSSLEHTIRKPVINDQLTELEEFMNQEDSNSKGRVFTKMKTDINQVSYSSLNKELSRKKKKNASLSRLKTLGMLWSVGQKNCFKSKNFTQPSPQAKQGKSNATPKNKPNQLFKTNKVMKLRENFNNLEERKKVKIGPKKKIQFTVYENSAKTNGKRKEKKSVSKHKEFQCQTINVVPSYHQKSLKDISIRALNSSTNRNKFQISQLQRQSKPQPSKQKFNFQAYLQKQSLTNHGCLLSQKISLSHEKALFKINEFRFIDSYISRSQILQKLNEYELKGEHECRWPLLIIDEVYTRMKAIPDK